ncbi:hypothetical protein [Lacihabitans sp. CCS-44]|nr:hypothetical protein [Lacihabitans sp. CCS-44]
MKTIHIGGRRSISPDTIWYLQSDQNYQKYISILAKCILLPPA